MERTLPYSWYVDPEILRREQERIFRSAWQYVGHLGQLPEPGTFFTAKAGRMPIVVTRAKDDEVRAFRNVCRHRGFQVADGEGKRETLQCPYHAWTYGLDGKLRAAPRADREPGFDPEEGSLAQLRLETWGPFVFVNADADAEPLADALEHRLRSESELEANWKIVCENFLECYHCAVAHPGFTAAVDVSPDAYRLATDRLTSSQFGPLRTERESFLTGGEVGRSQFHFLWPSFGINVFPGQPNLSCGPMVPLGPERTARFLDYFFAPGVDASWVEELLEFDDQIGREDTALVEGVQRGLRSGVLAEGRVLEESEQLVAHFQRLCGEALGK